MRFGTNEHHFQLFRENNKGHVSTECWAQVRPIDPAIVETLHLLNLHPGLATRWSCSGHPASEGKLTGGYVAMAYTRAGFDFVYGVYDQMTLEEHPRYTRAVLVHLTNLLSDYSAIDAKTLRRGWEALVLKFDKKLMRTEDTRKIFYGDLNRVLRQHLHAAGIKIPKSVA